MKRNLTTKAIIVAGGYSRRLKLPVPKQLTKVNRKPIVAYSLDLFEKCRAIDSIILVAQHKYLTTFKRLIKQYAYQKVECLCFGGATRQQSVFRGLQQVRNCDYVLIHDAVRPFVTEKIILDVLKAAKQFGAATSAVPTKDTIVQVKKGFIELTLSRSKLWHIQTPQAFKFKLLYQAHQYARAKAITDASDDAQLLLRIKKKVKLIEGSYENIKITTAFDLLLAEELAKKNLVEV